MADKSTQWRNEGMSYALKIAEEKGLDGLREELKFRGATQIPITYKRSSCDEIINKIKANTIDTMLVLSVAVLMDEFEFGKDKVAQFIERFNSKTDCLLGDYCTWSDLIEDIKTEYNIELKIRRNG